MNLENLYKQHSFKEKDIVIMFSDDNFEFEIGTFRELTLKRNRAIELNGNTKNWKIAKNTEENLDIVKRLRFTHSKKQIK